MATPTPTEAPKTLDPSFISDADWKKAQEKIKSLNDFAFTFVGKDKMNYYDYKNEVIIPLLALPKNKQNFDRIMSTKQEEPTTFRFSRNPITKKTPEDVARERGDI